MDQQQPLTHMKAFNQWINWRMQDGVKLPVDRQGGKIDAHNPVNWLTYKEASAAGGAAFVITGQDPFFCVDLDKCIDPATGVFAPGALAVVQRFPNAMLEISQSGTGAHIWGCGNLPENHAKVFSYQGQKVECYSRLRFIIIGQPCGGTEWLDWTNVLSEFVPLRETVNPDDWTAGPCTEWDGPQDDDELIRRMLAAKSSPDAVFGNKATFKQLWEGDAAALALAFPEGGERSFDASSADAALLQHLAFWTGKDCERIDRLFRRSGLMRDKYEKRGDYRVRSITGSIARCTTVYNKPQLKIQDSAAPLDAVTGVVKQGVQIMDVHNQLQLFKGCVYVREHHRVFTPDGSLLKPEQFTAAYGGFQFVMDSENAKMSEKAFECFTQSRAVTFPKVHNMCFRPDIAPGKIIDHEGRLLVNTYVPAQIDRKVGDVSRILDFMTKILPHESDRAQIMAYMAALVQHPGVKFQWCPVLQGVRGNGKTLLMTCVSKAIGEVYTHVLNPKDLESDFNGWVMNKLFVSIEEIYVADNRGVADTLKPLITNSRLSMQKKGVDQFTGDNRANFMATTNHKDAIHLTPDERGWAIYYTAQQSKVDLANDGMSGEYFPELYRWLNAGGFAFMAEYLHTYKIPDALNPATTMMRAPDTSSTGEVLKQSLGRIETEVLEQVDSDTEGFRGGWISSERLKAYFQEYRIKLSTRKHIEMLEKIGYIPHPALYQGRTSVAMLDENGKRPVLYIKAGSIQSSLTDQDIIIDTYRKAQGRTPMSMQQRA